MTLIRCTTVYGASVLMPGQPTVSTVKDAVVVGHALYDATGSIVMGSTYMRGEGSHGRYRLNAFCEPTSDVNIAACEPLPDGRYFWLGYFHSHYGHFLLSTLQRLWALPTSRADLRIVVVGDALDGAWETGFVRDLFGALGLRREMFVQVESHRRIPEIEVPRPAFVESSHAFANWSEFMSDLAVSLAGPDDGARDAAPLYLSRHALPTGTRSIVNEADLAATLIRRGVRVVSPEDLTLADQIRLWRRHEVIGGIFGSGLHSAAFVRAKRLLSINGDNNGLASQALIDAACDHRALYLNAIQHLRAVEAASGFNSRYEFVDPDRMADSIVRAFAWLRRGRAGMRVSPVSDTISRHLTSQEPLGRNLSRGRPALLSLTDPVWSRAPDDAAVEAAGAVSGHASSTDQRHTRVTDDPRWQVDLERPCLVTQVRVYNRNDTALGRPRALVILTSADGETGSRRCVVRMPVISAADRLPFRSSGPPSNRWQRASSEFRSSSETTSIRIRPRSSVSLTTTDLLVSDLRDLDLARAGPLNKQPKHLRAPRPPSTTIASFQPPLLPFDCDNEDA